jgi:hypothetical protein
VDRPLSACRRLESAMTEEEFRALLKLQNGEDAELIIESEVVWTATVRFDINTHPKILWASSTDKDVAIEDLVYQFFGDQSANS